MDSAVVEQSSQEELGVVGVVFVDDTTLVEILPRNSISYINMVADDVHRFSTSHRMKLTLLNARK